MTVLDIALGVFFGGLALCIVVVWIFEIVMKMALNEMRKEQETEQ